MGRPQQGVGPLLRSQAVWAGGQTGPSAARSRMKPLPKLQPAGREGPGGFRGRSEPALCLGLWPWYAPSLVSAAGHHVHC